MNVIQILDGGFGSQISRRINKSIDGDCLWSTRLLATNKTEVINTHLDFLNAGSTVICTNTYQASVDGFVKHLKLSEEQSYNLIKEAVKLLREAINIYKSKNVAGNRNILIAGSVGPYGASLHDGSEYTGGYKDSVSRSTLKEWHKPRISALLEEGVDLLALETIPCQKEAEVLLSIVEEFPNAKAWLSFNCKDGKSLASGENFQRAVEQCCKMTSDQLVAVGANCVAPAIVNELFFGINKICSVPLIVYPNSGEFYCVETGWNGVENCQPLESYVETWLDMGVTWIGGCCRVYPDNIVKLRQAVKSWQAKHS
ncbi:hypothetical protein Trydic_g8007 [Trypoxylus dichotomus]